MRSLTYLGLLGLLDGLPAVGLWLTSEFAFAMFSPGQRRSSSSPIRQWRCC
jgi:hypothetical protein